MKLPENVPVPTDRISTREELFEVLEMLGGFEEPQETDVASSCDLFTCFGAEPPISGSETIDRDISNEERLLMEIEPFTPLRSIKAQRIN